MTQTSFDSCPHQKLHGTPTATKYTCSICQAKQEQMLDHALYENLATRGWTEEELNRRSMRSYSDALVANMNPKVEAGSEIPLHRVYGLMLVKELQGRIEKAVACKERGWQDKEEDEVKI